MTMSQVHPAARARRRRAWRRLAVVSTLALGAGLGADVVFDNGSHLVAILVLGLCVVGVAAAFIAIPGNGGRGASEGRVGDWG
jgi:peptidoglycan/LPS O-acetylase OafA/YrhL